MTDCLSFSEFMGVLGCSFKSRTVLGKLGAVGHCCERPSLDRNNKIIHPLPCSTHKTKHFHSSLFLSPYFFPSTFLHPFIAGTTARPI